MRCVNLICKYEYNIYSEGHTTSRIVLYPTVFGHPHRLYN